MTVEPVLIDGEWRQAEAPVGDFSPTNPATKKPLSARYPHSSKADLDACAAAAGVAAAALAVTSPDVIASFLESFATGIEASVDALVEMAHLETGLPEAPRLRSVELPRTTNQLRQAAAAAREGSWVQATIDSKANIRSMLAPMGGAVLVFGPNNFPYAYNPVAGGDFAAAIAARNPVIAKAHPLHPGTSKLLAEAALEACRAAGLPRATLQLIYAMDPRLGRKLVFSDGIAAIGFTGARRSGLALKRAADRAGKPIYLELGSQNPVFVLPGALSERGTAIADELAASCTLGAGQFCTNPGLCVLVESERAEAFLARVAERFLKGAPATLLGADVEQGMEQGVSHLLLSGARLVCGGKVGGGSRYCFENTLLRVSGQDFLSRSKELQREVFGAVNLAVVARDVDQMVLVAKALEGNLTGCIYSHGDGDDDPDYRRVVAVLRSKVGRLLDDKVPTGVAVSPAMNHGGPYPATGHPGFTSVGIPAALRRFAALHCYDNVRPERLPPELRDENPSGIWRWLDGCWSRASVGDAP